MHKFCSDKQLEICIFLVFDVTIFSDVFKLFQIDKFSHFLKSEKQMDSETECSIRMTR